MNPHPRTDHLVTHQFKPGNPGGPGGSSRNKHVNSPWSDVKSEYCKALLKVARMANTDLEIKPNDSAAIAAAKMGNIKAIKTGNWRYLREIFKFLDELVRE